MSAGAGPGLAAVEWTFDPWRDQRGLAVLAVCGVLALWTVVWTFQIPVAVGVTLGIYSAWQLLPAMAPAECRVGPSGASLRRLLITTERPWGEVLGIHDVALGLQLSKYPWRAHRLDAIGALTLPMPGPRRAELRSLVRRVWHDWQNRHPGGVHAG